MKYNYHTRNTMTTSRRFTVFNIDAVVDALGIDYSEWLKIPVEQQMLHIEETYYDMIMKDTDDIRRYTCDRVNMEPTADTVSNGDDAIELPEVIELKCKTTEFTYDQIR